MSKLIRPADNFTMVDNGLLRDGELSLRAKGLYCLLFSKPDGWVFRLSVLVNESKEGRDAFNAAMVELVERGWVVKHPVRDGHGKFTHNDYELRISSDWKPVDGLTVNGKSASINTYSNKDVSKNTVIAPKSQKTVAYSEDFENLWAAYGRKGNKVSSYKKWRTLSAGQRDAAIAGLQAYLCSKRVREGFKKDCENYLSGHLWESDWSEGSSSGKSIMSWDEYRTAKKKVSDDNGWEWSDEGWRKRYDEYVERERGK